MARYLIEVPHGATREECERAIRIFLNTGSHFMTNADWGCSDGEHKAWITIDIESKKEARNILPPAFRPHAKITQLDKFSYNKKDEIQLLHDQ